MTDVAHMSDNKPVRLDPETCGCTDCIVGYSVPMSQATLKQIKKASKGKMQNATYYTDEELKDYVRRSS